MFNKLMSYTLSYHLLAFLFIYMHLPKLVGFCLKFCHCILLNYEGHNFVRSSQK